MSCAAKPYVFLASCDGCKRREPWQGKTSGTGKSKIGRFDCSLWRWTPQPPSLPATLKRIPTPPGCLPCLQSATHAPLHRCKRSGHRSQAPAAQPPRAGARGDAADLVVPRDSLALAIEAKRHLSRDGVEREKQSGAGRAVNLEDEPARMKARAAGSFDTLRRLLETVRVTRQPDPHKNVLHHG